MHHSQNAYEKISNTVSVSTVKKNPETNTVDIESIIDIDNTVETAACDGSETGEQTSEVPEI